MAEQIGTTEEGKTTQEQFMSNIQTPETQAMAAMLRTHKEWQSHAEDLEQRLNVAREALANLERRITFGAISDEHLNEARKALTATAPK